MRVQKKNILLVKELMIKFKKNLKLNNNEPLKRYIGSFNKKHALHLYHPNESN